MLEQPGRTLLVADSDGEIVGTADLLIVPNLMRRGAPWAILETVFVTDRSAARGSVVPSSMKLSASPARGTIVQAAVALE